MIITLEIIPLALNGDLAAEIKFWLFVVIIFANAVSEYITKKNSMQANYKNFGCVTDKMFVEGEDKAVRY